MPYREFDDGPGPIAVLILMLVALLLGLLAPDPVQGQLRGPIRNLTADTSPAAGDMLLVDKASPLVSRKLTLSTLTTYLTGLGAWVPTSRVITCTAPLLCAGSTSMDLSANRTLAISPATLTSTTNGGPVTWSATGSTITGATNEGLRNAMLTLFDTKTDDVNNAVLMIDSIQTTNAGAACITRTGLHVKTYTMPDNGCDTSGALIVQSGGGSGISVYKLHTLRPTGFTDYSSSIQGAIEAGTNDQSQAGLFMSGINIGGATTNSSTAILARVDNSTSRGIVIQPNDNVFDSRIALTVGTAQINAAPINVKYSLTMAGDVTANSVTTPNVYGSSSSGGTLHLFSTSHATKGKILFGTSAYDEVNNRLGIGTVSPDSLLHITANAATLPTPISGTLVHVGNVDSTGSAFTLDSFASANTIACRRADTSNASPSALATNDIICALNGYGYGTSAYGAFAGASVRLIADQTWTLSAQGTRIDFLTDDLNTTSPTVKWSISANGHLTHTQTTAPTVACTGTGTSPSAPTIDSGGTDHKFTVVVNTGTGSPGSTGTCTVTFATAFSAARPIVCMLVKGVTAWGNTSAIMETTESASAPVFTWTNSVGGVATALTTSTSYKFSCIGGF